MSRKIKSSFKELNSRRNDLTGRVIGILSGRLRWRACLGIRADPYGRHRVCCFQPRHKLVLALQIYKNKRGSTEGDGDGMAGPAKGTAITVAVLCPGGRGLDFGGRRHVGADRRHIERIGGGVGDHAESCDRCNELHQDRQQHDWNECFQPAPHDFPRERPWSPSICVMACREFGTDLPRLARFISLLHQGNNYRASPSSSQGFVRTCPSAPCPFRALQRRNIFDGTKRLTQRPS